MKKKSILLFAVSLILLFSSCASTDQPLGGTLISATVATTTPEEDKLTCGLTTEYLVFYPNELKEYEMVAKNYFCAYADPNLLNIFDLPLQRIKYAKPSVHLSEGIFYYTFDSNCEPLEIRVNGYSKAGFTEKSPLEYIATRYTGEDFEDAIISFEDAREWEGFNEDLSKMYGDDLFVSIGNAYYVFGPGGKMAGISEIFFIVNGQSIQIKFPTQFLNESEGGGVVIRHPQSEVLDRLSHISTAPEQIDAILDAWEGKW